MLKVKAKERQIKIGDNQVWRYVMIPELYSTLDKEKVISEAALRSGISEGTMSACWNAAGKVIKAWATEGHSVALPGLGNMRFSLSAKAVADVNDVKTSLITTRRILFAPAQELKNELAATSIQITCYDRNGEVVKRVTSDDDGTVEDSENGESTGGSDNGTGTGNTGGSTGGSDTGGSTGGSGSSGSNDDPGAGGEEP